MDKKRDLIDRVCEFVIAGATAVILAAALVVLVTLINGCAGIPQVGQQLNASTNYRMEIPFTVDGMAYAGYAVLPQKPSYEINFQAKDKPLIVSVGSCHREETLPAGQSKYSYVFTPQAIETDNSCPLHISSLSSKVWYRGAILMFENPAAYSVRAKVLCNGSQATANGIGLCQAKTGLIEELSFDNAMNIGTPAAGCAMPSPSVDAKTWLFQVSSSECQYKFGERSAPKNQFVMTFSGYDTYLLPTGGN